MLNINNSRDSTFNFECAVGCTPYCGLQVNSKTIAVCKCFALLDTFPELPVFDFRIKRGFPITEVPCKIPTPCRLLNVQVNLFILREVFKFGFIGSVEVLF